jgi:uroporphyrin-III C-methyltransferase / precorrin-2 dehydrogenase / sirohydrochlorin ferrochelatase
MDYLPLFLKLSERPAVVVGGGIIALRKVEWLLKAGAAVTVVAPQLTPALAAQVRAGAVRHVAEMFREEQLAGAALVVAATGERAVNSVIAAAARRQAVPINVVDDAELSSFIFPAIVERAPLLVAISSSGHAPVLARWVREQIEALLPARLGALARFMGAQRAAVRDRLALSRRRAFWERLLQGRTGSAVLAGQEQQARQLLEHELQAAASTPTAGEVYLIGAGPGDPDLLTLRALQLLQQADVILYDRLVSPQILERARRDAERIFVGKEAGERGQQQRIHALLVELARAGKRVARLKGGDPFVFGRGGEEIEVLAAHGIGYQIVPGITAALGAAASAALPLTHRQLARSVTFVNGHDAGSSAAPWRYFADPAHTAVFYMGVAQLPGIVARLRAAGAEASHPAAVVERATLPQQRLLRGSLQDIARRARQEQITAPALLIVGAIAAHGSAQQLAEVAAPPAAARA